jgi:hypothetical protein
MTMVSSNKRELQTFGHWALGESFSTASTPFRTEGRWQSLSKDEGNLANKAHNASSRAAKGKRDTDAQGRVRAHAQQEVSSLPPQPALLLSTLQSEGLQ